MKNKLIKILSTSLAVPALATPFCVSSCYTINKKEQHKTEEKNISIQGPRKIFVGETKKYNAIVEPTTMSQDVVWSLSKSSIYATIDEDGVLTAKKDCKIYVIATSAVDPDLSCSFQVMIVKPAPTSITVSFADDTNTDKVMPSINIGDKKKCIAKVEPYYAVQEIEWSVDQQSLADIDKDGNLTAVASGVVTVIAKSKEYDVKGEMKVNITLPDPVKIQIDGPNRVLPGEVIEYKLITTPEPSYLKVDWSVKNYDSEPVPRATIDQNGKMTAAAEAKPGDVLIEAKAYKQDGSTYVTDSLRVDIETYHNLSIVENCGKSFDIENTLIKENEPHRAKFISTKYKTSDGNEYDVHKELKLSDLQIYNKDTGADITSRCSLHENMLTIPSDCTTNDINIIITGAEISDWITWDDIAEIAASDDGREDEYAKKLLQVGDYKMLTDKGQSKGYARIIDFYHDNYIDPSTSTSKVATFTFESLHPFVVDKWGVFGEPGQRSIYSYFSSPIKEKLDLTSMDSIASITRTQVIKQLCHHTKQELQTVYMKYFPLSWHEYGEDAITKVEKGVAYYAQEGTKYAYYDSNSAYKNRLSINARRIKPQGWAYFMLTTWLSQWGIAGSAESHCMVLEDGDSENNYGMGRLIDDEYPLYPGFVI